MTPQSIISLARYILKDTENGHFRQSDAELVGYVNAGLKEACELRPEAFRATGDYTCTSGQTEQAISFDDARQLVGVVRIKNGSAVHLMDLNALSQFNPSWASDTAGPAENWAPKPGDPLRFYIYPKAPVSQVLEIDYIRNPGSFALNDTISNIPLTWESALADYVIYRAESKDDEHVLSNRSAQHYASFVQKITGERGAPQGA
jgi:hypothetical protein